MNNMFMLSRLTGALSPRKPTTGNDGVRDLLAGEVVGNIKTLDKFIGTDGFACCGRITLADCALVPGLFFVDRGHWNDSESSSRRCAFSTGMTAGVDRAPVRSRRGATG